MTEQGGWWDGWVLAVFMAGVLCWILRQEHIHNRNREVQNGRPDRKGLDFGGNQAPRRIAQRPWGRHGGEDSREETGPGSLRQIRQEDSGTGQIRQGASRLPSQRVEWDFLPGPEPEEPDFDDAPIVHMYSPDIQRGGRCCVVCGRLPGGVWHYRRAE